MKNVFIKGNKGKMQRLQGILQQLKPIRNSDSNNWCGSGNGIANTSCPSISDVCYKETWTMDGQMRKFIQN